MFLKYSEYFLHWILFFSDTPKAKADKKLPTAFANFFNKGNKPGKKEEGKGKKKEEKPKKEKGNT